MEYMRWLHKEEAGEVTIEDCIRVGCKELFGEDPETVEPAIKLFLQENERLEGRLKDALEYKSAVEWLDGRLRQFPQHPMELENDGPFIYYDEGERHWYDGTLLEALQQAQMDGK